MEFGPDYFERCLAEFRPRMRNYNWIWAILRARFRQRRGQFPHRYYQLLRRFFDLERPYFIGKTSDGTLYLGDCRESYAVASAVVPDHDDAMTSFLRRRTAERPGACLDIGSNMGIVAASVARALAGRDEVIAFEPVPETAKRAAATFALNRLTNIRLFQCALGETDGEIEFYLAKNCSEWASTSPVGNDNMEWVKTTVPCRRLDTLRAERRIGTVGVMKIDVEGYEPKVLAGAHGLIQSDQPEMVFEYNHEIAPKLGWSVSDAAGLVQGCGAYEFHVLDESRGLAAFPPKPSETGFVNIYCQPALAPR